MKKILLTIFVFFAVVTMGYEAMGFDFEKESVGYNFGRGSQIIVSGYYNYPPFSYIDKNNQFRTIFKPVLDVVQRYVNKPITFKPYNMTATEQIDHDIRVGDTDVFIGGYSQTKHFENLNMIFPALINNPITFFVLPTKTSTITDISDLKKLKGVRCSQEVFSDFVEQKISEYNLEVVDSPYQMYEKLFTGKADYIIAGYYYGIIEAIKLGVYHQISAAKTPLWNIPVFIGSVKISPFSNQASAGIVAAIRDAKLVAAIKENINRVIQQYEADYAGVIQPTFGLEKKFENTDKAPEQASDSQTKMPTK